jgi:nitrate reductase NapE component
MMKSLFIILGLSLCCPMSYQASLTNRIVVPAQEATDMNKELAVEDYPIQEETVKNISKAARARSTGRIIGIVVLVIVVLAIVAVACLFGLAGYVELAFQMGWVRK